MAASLLYSGAVLSDFLPDRIEPGVVLCRSGKYTSIAECEANSVIQMVPVIDNMFILGMDIYWTALGSSVTLDVGDDGNVDRFFDGIDASALGNATLAVEGDVATCFGQVYAADNTIDIKILGAVLPVAAVIQLDVYYKMLDGIRDEITAFGA